MYLYKLKNEIKNIDIQCMRPLEQQIQCPRSDSQKTKKKSVVRTKFGLKYLINRIIYQKEMYSEFDYLKSEYKNSNYRNSRDYTTTIHNTEYLQKNYDSSNFSQYNSSNHKDCSKNLKDNDYIPRTKKSSDQLSYLRNSVNVLPNYEQELEREKNINRTNNSKHNTTRNKSPNVLDYNRDYYGYGLNVNGRSKSPYNKKYDLEMSTVSAYSTLDYKSRKNKYFQQPTDYLSKSNVSGYGSRKNHQTKNARQFEKKTLQDRYKNYLNMNSTSPDRSREMKNYSSKQASKYDEFEDYQKKQYNSKHNKEDCSYFDNKNYYSANPKFECSTVAQFGSSLYENNDKRFGKKKYNDKILTSTLSQINQVLSKSKISRKNSKSKIDEYKPDNLKKDTTSLLKEPSVICNKLNFKNNISDFILGKTKGQGKFGTVSMAIHKSTQTIYALKKISKQIIKSHMLENQLALEIRLQSYLNHPNILRLYGFFHDHEHVYLVLEYMQDGTLFQYLRKRTNKLTEKQVSAKIKQISSAVKYLHDLDIAHRDIKPENIVLSGGVAKLCDFGWATRCTDRRKTYCGTFDYAAPQILEGKQYDWCVDLWCLGVLTFQLLTGKVPFYHISRKETMKKILRVDRDQIVFPPQTSLKAKDFVQCLIKKDPHERSRADELMNHPFLTEDKKQLPNV